MGQRAAIADKAKQGAGSQEEGHTMCVQDGANFAQGPERRFLAEGFLRRGSRDLAWRDPGKRLCHEGKGIPEIAQPVAGPGKAIVRRAFIREAAPVLDDEVRSLLEPMRMH